VVHMILQCRDTKLWPISGCIHANLSASLYPEGQSQQKGNGQSQQKGNGNMRTRHTSVAIEERNQVMCKIHVKDKGHESS